jgi:hypothetical protein
MKSFALPLAFAAVALTSCSTAKKKSEASTPAGIRDILAVAEPVPESTIESLKAIANDPASLLPPAATAEEPSAPATAPALADAAPDPSDAPDLRTLWKRPGINPEEVNPGDVFYENAGPVLHKTFSLADELKEEERSTLLDQFTTSKTERVPVTINKSELVQLQSEMPGDYALPTRSVALDFRSGIRTLRGEPYLQLIKALERGESGGAVESAPRREGLKKQIAAMTKQLKAGERLFVVTRVTETDKLRATYPGAPLGSRDTELIRNAIAGLYPHLISLEATKTPDAVELIAPPRILWEFETREIKLDDDKLVIDFESVVQI